MIITTGPVTCPYCNASLERIELPQKAGKIVCPRCGEPLPPALTAAATSETAPEKPPERFPSKPVAANRRVGLLLLAGMSAVALAALIFALVTVAQRRSRDPRPLPSPAIAIQPPAELAAFAYLPRDTNLAAGVHVADLLKDDEAKQLLTGGGVPGIQWLLDLLRAKTALALDDLDHVVAGATLGAKLPTVTLVVRTKAAYSKDALEKAMKQRPTLRDKEPLYRFSAPLGEAFLWARGAKTLILLWRPDALQPKDLDEIPATPASGAEAIPKPLRAFVSDRLEKQSLIWLVGEVGKLKQLAEVFAWLKGAPRLPEPWVSVPFLSLSVVNESKKEDKPALLTLRGQFQAADGKTAQALEAALQNVHLPGEESRRVTGPPPGTADAKELWVLWQTRLRAEGVAAWLASWKK